ncbi:MAG: 4Fe-4S dicluster domain-containing protein [Dehalococcoidales bacterium]|nr:4Fe-4S dicluster domain-containing protein [Dehalococcoidales bacterium]
MRWGMVVNLIKCTRCHACIAACRIEHFLPMGMNWPRLIAWETDVPGEELTTIPVRCNQCKDAPCVEVCPAEATKKREDGIVYVDNDICVGCRYCIIACPYQNRTFLSRDKDPGYFPGYERTRFEKAGRKIYPHTVGTTEKCDFCMERIDAGLAKGLVPGKDREATPACVNTCQARALTFGDLDDPESEVSKLIKEKNAFQLHPEYGTDPSVYYIDGKIGNAPSNIAPREEQTASHMQHLSTMEERAKQIFGKK